MDVQPFLLALHLPEPQIALQTQEGHYHVAITQENAELAKEYELSYMQYKTEREEYLRTSVYKPQNSLLLEQTIPQELAPDSLANLFKKLDQLKEGLSAPTDSILLTAEQEVDFKTQLDKLNKKVTDFEQRERKTKEPKKILKLQKAKKAMQTLHTELQQAFNVYETTKDAALFKQTCKYAIYEAQHILAEHRGLRDIIQRVLISLGMAPQKVSQLSFMRTASVRHLHQISDNLKLHI